MTLDKLIVELQGILDRLDRIAATDELEELNAVFEDTLFMLSESDPDGEDFEDDLSAAIDELDKLAEDYASFAECADEAAALRAAVARMKLILNNM